MIMSLAGSLRQCRVVSRVCRTYGVSFIDPGNHLVEVAIERSLDQVFARSLDQLDSYCFSDGFVLRCNLFCGVSTRLVS